MQVAIGQKLEIRGRYFLRGRNKNTVVFKRTGGKAIFVKAAIGTTKLLRLTVPAKLKSALRTRAALRSRPASGCACSRGSSASASRRPRARPIVGPELPPTPAGSHSRPPDGDCDGDGIKNGAETDDDGDLLTDAPSCATRPTPARPTGR